MSITHPLREVSEHGFEACDTEDGSMIWALDSRVIDTVDEVLNVGRRMAAASGSRFASSFLSLSEASLEPPSTAVGGGTSRGAGEEPPSGLCKWFGVFANEDSEDGVWNPGRLRRFCAASSAASDRETAEGFFRAVLKVKRVRGPKLARVSSSFSRRPLIALSYRPSQRSGGFARYGSVWRMNQIPLRRCVDHRQASSPKHRGLHFPIWRCLPLDGRSHLFAHLQPAQCLQACSSALVDLTPSWSALHHTVTGLISDKPVTSC